MNKRNVVVTSISIPKTLLGNISKRIKDLKKRQECKSVSDYFTKLAFRDIRDAQTPAVVKPPDNAATL